MTEAAVVLLFMLVRALFLCTILLILPKITRKGLLFGNYVGEKFANHEPVRELVQKWRQICILLTVAALSIGFGIGFSGHPVAGNLTCTAILLTLGPVLYFRFHFLARRFVPTSPLHQTDLAVASIEFGPPKGEVLAKIALAVSILAGIGVIAYAWLNYGALPDQIPLRYPTSDPVDKWFEKTWFRVMMVPLLNLVLGPFLATQALLIAHAKKSLRAGSGGHSVEAQIKFRAAMANAMSWTTLFITAILSLLSVQMIRVGLSQIESIGFGVMVLAIFMLIILVSYLIRILAVYGQGGSRLEKGCVDAPLTNGLAHDSYWVWGMFYFNREDPSIMVEQRFGIGYTLNFGNFKAVIPLGILLAALLVLVAMILIELLGV